MSALSRATFATALFLTSINPAVSAENQSIPRLPTGPHMGFIDGFDDLRPGADGIDRLSRANDLRETAIAAGMTIARAQIDWRDLETSPGVYNLAELEAVVEYAGRGGVHVFLSISTLDIADLVIPDDLMGRDGNPRNGL